MDDDLGVAGSARRRCTTRVRAGNAALADGDRTTRCVAALADVRAMPACSASTRWTRSGATGALTTDYRSAVDALVRWRSSSATAARARKDFAAADAIRDELKAAGIVVEDTAARDPRLDARERMPDGRQLPAPRRRRTEGSKKGATGRLRRPDAARRLQGKGPTPPAEARTGHPAARRAAAAAKQSATGRGTPARRSRAPLAASRARDALRGRCSAATRCVEALRAGVPATALYVAARVDVRRPGRARRCKLAGDRGLPLLEAPRAELDRITGGAVHQGLALQVPPYDYAHPDDLLDARRRRRPGAAARRARRRHRPAQPRRGRSGRSAAFGAHGVVVPERRVGRA